MHTGSAADKTFYSLSWRHFKPAPLSLAHTHTFLSLDVTFALPLFNCSLIVSSTVNTCMSSLLWQKCSCMHDVHKGNSEPLIINLPVRCLSAYDRVTEREQEQAQSSWIFKLIIYTASSLAVPQPNLPDLIVRVGCRSTQATGVDTVCLLSHLIC